MNIERAAMKSRLAGLKDEKKTLIVRAEVICDSLGREVNTALIPVEETDMARVSALYGDLLEIHTRISRVNVDIYKLERKLGN